VAVDIVHNSYGKSAIRLTKVTRHRDRHDLAELSVSITLLGDFARSYTHGDNSLVVATDSMKNTVYVLAKEHPVDSPESFALHLAEHFVSTYRQVRRAEITIEQSQWRRILVKGRPHPTAFESGGDEYRRAAATVEKVKSKRTKQVQGGLGGLLVLKTTDSAFEGFVRDSYTTLPETSDRILATSVSASWTYKSGKTDYNKASAAIRTAMLETFATHKSKAVQQTLLAMGEAALKAAPEVQGVYIHMPNKHRVPFNLKPFGLNFEKDIFVTTDEPSGDIRAYVERK
jgi:urate oxidase